MHNRIFFTVSDHDRHRLEMIDAVWRTATTSVSQLCRGLWHSIGQQLPKRCYKMRASPRLSIALFAALNIGVTIAAKAEATDWRDAETLKQPIREADRRGDFENATNAAEKCVTITRGARTESKSAPGDYYCMYYLSSALRNGRGVPRDERRAFLLLNDLVATYRDDDAALDLAEAYLDGAGTSRDPVEAGVIFWRVKHGAWSIYSDYWGMCNNCEEFWAHEKVVGERIERELTTTEKKQANTIGAARFPEIAARVTYRDVQIEVATAVLIAATGSLLWLFFRSLKWFFRSLKLNVRLPRFGGW